MNKEINSVKNNLNQKWREKSKFSCIKCSINNYNLYVIIYKYI